MLMICVILQLSQLLYSETTCVATDIDNGYDLNTGPNFIHNYFFCAYLLKHNCRLSSVTIINSFVQ